MPRLFSRRNSPRPERLRYDVPEEVRRCIVVQISQLAQGYMSSFSFDAMLDDVGRILSAEYPLCRSPYEAARTSNDPVIEHFASCPDAIALDFIEACFHAFHNPGQRGVEAINRIFEDAGVGYYLTPYIETVTDKPGNLFGRPAGRTVEIQRPEIIRKDSEFLHAEAVKPALSLLSDNRFKGANEEFLQAHKHYRDGDDKACLVECLKAFESTMKIICDAKKWAYDSKATAHPLIQICLDKGLVQTFNQQQLTSLRTLLESGIPTIRNKQGGHGQGSQPKEVPAELARYALNITAATIVLLVESAKL